MTAIEIPTVGEWAGRALEAFNTISRATEQDQGSGGSDEAAIAAVGLVQACFALMSKFPIQTRRAFSRSLPFSELERELLHHEGLLEDPAVTTRVGSRVSEWVHRSPVMVDEVNINVADFLIQLQPHLDRWDQRQQVDVAIQRVRLDHESFA